MALHSAQCVITNNWFQDATDVHFRCDDCRLSEFPLVYLHYIILHLYTQCNNDWEEYHTKLWWWCWKHKSRRLIEVLFSQIPTSPTKTDTYNTCWSSGGEEKCGADSHMELLRTKQKNTLFFTKLLTNNKPTPRATTIVIPEAVSPIPTLPVKMSMQLTAWKYTKEKCSTKFLLPVTIIRFVYSLCGPCWDARLSTMCTCGLAEGGMLNN